MHSEQVFDSCEHVSVTPASGNSEPRKVSTQMIHSISLLDRIILSYLEKKSGLESLIGIATSKGCSSPLKGLGPTKPPHVDGGHGHSALWASYELRKIVIQTFHNGFLDALQADIWFMSA